MEDSIQTTDSWLRYTERATPQMRIQLDNGKWVSTQELIEGRTLVKLKYGTPFCPVGLQHKKSPIFMPSADGQAGRYVCTDGACKHHNAAIIDIGSKEKFHLAEDGSGVREVGLQLNHSWSWAVKLDDVSWSDVSWDAKEHAEKVRARTELLERAKEEAWHRAKHNPVFKVRNEDFDYGAWSFAVEVACSDSVIEVAPRKTCSRGQVVTKLFRKEGTVKNWKLPCKSSSCPQCGPHKLAITKACLKAYGNRFSHEGTTKAIIVPLEPNQVQYFTRLVKDWEKHVLPGNFQWRSVPTTPTETMVSMFFIPGGEPNILSKLGQFISSNRAWFGHTIEAGELLAKSISLDLWNAAKISGDVARVNFWGHGSPASMKFCDELRDKLSGYPKEEVLGETTECVEEVKVVKVDDTPAINWEEINLEPNPPESELTGVPVVVVQPETLSLVSVDPLLEEIVKLEIPVEFKKFGWVAQDARIPKLIDDMLADGRLKRAFSGHNRGITKKIKKIDLLSDSLFDSFVPKVRKPRRAK